MSSPLSHRIIGLQRAYYENVKALQQTVLYEVMYKRGYHAVETHPDLVEAASAKDPDVEVHGGIAWKRDQQDNLETMPYREFLDTDYWRLLRELILEDRGPACARCGSADGEINLHHKTYEHRGREAEYPDDLEVLCRDCHKKEHGIDEPEEKEPNDEPSI